MLVLGLVGCTDEPAPAPAPAAAPSPSPSPSPSPTLPTLVPVVGVADWDVVDGSRPVRLGFADDGRTDVDVSAAVTAVSTSLDQFLTGVQAGEADLAVLGAEWLPEQDPAAAEMLTTQLATRENPVASAVYTMTVQVEPTASLIGVDAGVTRLDGTIQTVGMVFDVTGDRPLLHLVGEAGGA